MNRYETNLEWVFRKSGLWVPKPLRMSPGYPCCCGGGYPHICRDDPCTEIPQYFYCTIANSLCGGAFDGSYLLPLTNPDLDTYCNWGAIINVIYGGYNHQMFLKTIDYLGRIECTIAKWPSGGIMLSFRRDYTESVNCNAFDSENIPPVTATVCCDSGTTLTITATA